MIKDNNDNKTKTDSLKEEIESETINGNKPSDEPTNYQSQTEDEITDTLDSENLSNEEINGNDLNNEDTEITYDEQAHQIKIKIYYIIVSFSLILPSYNLVNSLENSINSSNCVSSLKSILFISFKLIIWT